MYEYNLLQYKTSISIFSFDIYFINFSFNLIIKNVHEILKSVINLIENQS